MNFGRKLLQHKLISGSFYIFIGSVGANVLAFLLNLYFARNLHYSDYAIFASVLSVIVLASIPAGSINTIIVKFATDYFAKNQNGKLKSLYMMFLQFIASLSCIIFVLFVVLAIPLKTFLHIDNSWYIIVAGVVLASIYLNTLNTAFLQSLLKFEFISILSVVSGVVKLIVGVVLVNLGYKAFGGLGSIFFMTFASFLIGFFPLKNILRTQVEDDINSKITNKILAYAIPTFISTLFLTSFISMDIILVKHFFSAREAGFYSGLSLVGKVIFYFTASIPTVMLPLLVKRHATGKEFNKLFCFALLLVAAPSMIIVVFYFLFPSFVINLFLGGRDYIQISKYLGLFGIFTAVFSMVNVFVIFFLSLHRTKIAPIIVLCALFQIVLISLFHENFYEVIGASIAVCSLLLIILMIFYIKNYKLFLDNQLKE